MDEMIDRTDGRAVPMHLWVVGLLALVWNGFGGYDYLMTRMRNTDYLSQMGMDPNELLAYIDSYPIWAQAGWGLGVWMGVLGAILLLMRNRYAVHSFMLSLVGMVLSFGYQYLGPPAPPEMTHGPMWWMPLVIFLVGVGLFLYARQMRIKGVLR